MIKATLGDYLSPDDLAALDRPAGEAVGLPGIAYGPGFYDLEQRALFPRAWCAVGYSSDIPEPGDARPVDLAGWPLLLVRGKDGQIRAFHNVCRHRANRVVDAPCQGLGNLVCPYHGWTYGLDGKLLRTPRIGGQRAHDDPGFDTTDVDLKPVRVARWLDYVLVNIDGKAPAFAEHIAPLDALLSDYDLTDLRMRESWSIDFPANWKLTIENAIEDYHLPFIHGELVRGVVESRPRLDFAERCFHANSSVFEYRERSRANEAMALNAGLPWLLQDDPAIERRTFVISVFPTGFINTRVSYLWLWLILPDGAGRTRIDTRYYYKGEAATDPAFADDRRKIVEEMGLVMEEDVALVRNVQSNMERPGEAGIRTRFSPFWEANIQRFQQSVVSVLQDG